MSEPTVETNSVLVRHQGKTVRVHTHEYHPGWTFRIDNPTVYNIYPDYGFDPRFPTQDEAVEACIRYINYLTQFQTAVETAQETFLDQLHEFPVINNLHRDKRPHEAVNG